MVCYSDLGGIQSQGGHTGIYRQQKDLLLVVPIANLNLVWYVEVYLLNRRFEKRVLSSRRNSSSNGRNSFYFRSCQRA